MTASALRELIDTELAGKAPEGARTLAAELARRGGTGCAAVLYYGSALRAGSLEGILDFYVLMDDVRAWPAPALARLAARMLPPNVGYLEHASDGQTLRAKFAVIGLAQFARRLEPESFDTTLWARFCQPALCLWSRSPADRERVTGLVCTAVETAARWAAMLGAEQDRPAGYWQQLFGRTYSAELRVEKSGRPGDIVNKDPQRYAQALTLAWQGQGIAWETMDNEQVAPKIGADERRRATSRWQRLQRWGPRLNVLRLLKAAFTFDGAMDYVAWKIERHRGVRIEVTEWQRRHPLLAAPGLYWRLRRQGIVGR